MMPNKMNKLYLGSGKVDPSSVWAQEWTTLDALPENDPDIVAQVPPFPGLVHSVKWDVVLMVHTLEHFYLWEARDLLVEIHEILAPGGVFVTEQPDLRFVCSAFLGQVNLPQMRQGVRPEYFGIAGLYGDQVGHAGDPFYTHKWGWTPDSLPQFMAQCGWDPRNIRVSRAQYHEPVRDFRVQATKVDPLRDLE